MNINHANRVIVGIDDSLAGLQAVREAVNAARGRNTSLHAIRVLPVAPPYGWAVLPDPTEPERAARQLIRDAFDRAVGGRPSDLEFHAVVRHGSAGPALTAYARSGDLLVLGRDRGLLSNVLGDGTVRHCTRHARCPVLVVPPPEMAAAGSVRRQVSRLRRDLRRLGEAGIDPKPSGTPG